MIGLFDAMSIQVLARPAWVVLHVTVGAVDALVTIVDSRIQPLDSFHVLIVTLSAVPTGLLVNWALVYLILRKEKSSVSLRGFSSIGPD